MRGLDCIVHQLAAYHVPGARLIAHQQRTADDAERLARVCY